MTQISNHSEYEPDYESLVAAIRRLLLDRLHERMLELVDGTNDRLFDLTSSAKDKEERNRHYELMRKFRDCKSLVYDDFFTHVRSAIRPHTEIAQEKNKLKADDSSELSLIDNDAMENIVLVKNIGEKSAGTFYETLSTLESRIAYLKDKTDDIFEKSAISPVSLCDAFNEALSTYFDLLDKKPLFLIFSDVVVSQLGPTYKDINKLLTNAGVLPDIKPEAPKKAIKPPSSQAMPPGSQPEVPHNTGGYAMTAAPGQMSPVGDRSSAGAAELTRNQISEIIQNYFGSAASGVSGASQNTGTPSVNAPAASPAPQNTSIQTYENKDILSALSQIQKNPEFNQPGNEKLDSETIKQALLSQIAKASGGIVTKQINQIAEKTINFIELIFDAIIEDDNISDTIKTLLLRLQIPVIKAAMIDQDFFVADSHPARVLLDRIAETGIGITDHNDDMYIKLDGLITRIVNEYELNTESFQGALEELNAFVDEKNKEALIKEEESQRAILKAHARKTILEALRKITTGKTLPELIHPLVLKRWPSLMYNHYLAHGKENDEWVVINEILRDIVNSVQPVTSPEALAELIAIRNKLAETAYSYLIRSTQDKQDVHNIIKGLEETHTSIIESSEFNVEEADTSVDTIKTTYVPPDPKDHLPEIAADDKPVLPSNIMPGMWFKVYMGDEKPARRCKLSVIIAADSKLVFVNYQGEIIVEKTFDEFVSEIKNEKSKIIMGHSTFDHALNRAVSQVSH